MNPAEIRSKQALELLRQVALARHAHHLPGMLLFFSDREGNLIRKP
jgi:hypothetical protein